MQNHLILKLFPIVFLSIASCSPYYPGVKMNVQGYRDPMVDYSFHKSFAIVPVSQNTPLIEKELLHMVALILEDQGYKYDETNPSFYIVTDFYVGPYTYYKPPTTIPIPLFVKGKRTTVSGSVGRDWVNLSVKEKDRIEVGELKVGGGMKTAYYHNIQLYFIDGERFREKDSVQLIWRGGVDTNSPISDVAYVAPVMLDELLTEFPKRTGKPPIRYRDISYFKLEDDDPRQRADEP